MIRAPAFWLLLTACVVAQPAVEDVWRCKTDPSGLDFPPPPSSFQYRTAVTSVTTNLDVEVHSSSAGSAQQSFRLGVEERSTDFRRLLTILSNSLHKSLLFDLEKGRVLVLDHPLSYCQAYPLDFFVYHDPGISDDYVVNSLLIFDQVWNSFIREYSKKFRFKSKFSTFERGVFLHTYNLCFEINPLNVIKAACSWAPVPLQWNDDLDDSWIEPIYFDIQVYKKNNLKVPQRIYVNFYGFSPSDLENSDKTLGLEGQYKGCPIPSVPSLPSSFRYRVFATDANIKGRFQYYNVFNSSTFKLQKIDYLHIRSYVTNITGMKLFDYHNRHIISSAKHGCTIRPMKNRYIEALTDFEVFEKNEFPTEAEHFHLDAKEAIFKGEVTLHGRISRVYSRCDDEDEGRWNLTWYFDSQLQEYEGKPYSTPVRILTWAIHQSSAIRKKLNMFAFHPRRGTEIGDGDLSFCSSNTVKKHFHILLASDCQPENLHHASFISSFRTFLASHLIISVLQMSRIHLEKTPLSLPKEIPIRFLITNYLIQDSGKNISLQDEHFEKVAAILKNKIDMHCPITNSICQITGQLMNVSGLVDNGNQTNESSLEYTMMPYKCTLKVFCLACINILSVVIGYLIYKKYKRYEYVTRMNLVLLKIICLYLLLEMLEDAVSRLGGDEENIEDQVSDEDFPEIEIQDMEHTCGQHNGASKTDVSTQYSTRFAARESAHVSTQANGPISTAIATEHSSQVCLPDTKATVEEHATSDELDAAPNRRKRLNIQTKKCPQAPAKPSKLHAKSTFREICIERLPSLPTGTDGGSAQNELEFKDNFKKKFYIQSEPISPLD